MRVVELLCDRPNAYSFISATVWQVDKVKGKFSVTEVDPSAEHLISRTNHVGVQPVRLSIMLSNKFITTGCLNLKVYYIWYLIHTYKSEDTAFSCIPRCLIQYVCSTVHDSLCTCELAYKSSSDLLRKTTIPWKNTRYMRMDKLQNLGSTNQFISGFITIRFEGRMNGNCQ